MESTLLTYSPTIRGFAPNHKKKKKTVKKNANFIGRPEVSSSVNQSPEPTW
jgi:hypothetical protein